MTQITDKFPWKIYIKPIMIQIFLILSIMVIGATVARHLFSVQFMRQSERQLHDTISSMARDLPDSMAQKWCIDHARSTDIRFTIVSPTGKVLCDSQHEASTMEDHSRRPEIMAAWSTGYGTVVRSSPTMSHDFLYAAVPSENHSVVLRAAIPLDHLAKAQNTFDQFFWGEIILIVLMITISVILTGRQLIHPLSRMLAKARHISRPDTAAFENVNAEYGHETRGEWSDLEMSLETIRRDLNDKIDALTMEREEHAALMSAISEAIIAVDLKDRILFYNSRFALLFGGKKIENRAILGEVIREPEILEAFQEVFKTSSPLEKMAIQLGEEYERRFFSASISPLRDHKREIYGAVCVFHDVTELKRAEKIRIDFVANVSHELRTPLTSIKGYAETLRSDFATSTLALPSVWQEFVQTILKNTDRLMNLINDLLDLSAIESTDAWQWEPIDTKDFSGRVVQKMHDVFAAKEHTLTLNAAVPVVIGDENRLEQVLVNLLDNACKYTPKNGRIEINWITAGDGKTILLKVSDNGPGIAAEHHARLFERFYRIDKGRSRDMGGTGLGLAIVKHIMQRHGGSIRLESRMGAGSTFICSFPTHKIPD